MKTTTLFEQLGGMESVKAVVKLFYEKVTSDSSVKHFFIDIEMKSQSQKLSNFIAYALGAPLTYTGKSMQDAHARMDISEDQFSAVASHLVSSLRELGVKEDHIQQVTEIVMSTKKDVLGKSKQ